MYQIKYNYDTGDSFHTEQGREEILEMEWKSLDVAKQNLQRIKEHYQYYRARNSYRPSGEEKMVMDTSHQRDWAVPDKYNRYNVSQYSIKLYTDDGKPWQIFAPWCGYFESLNWAEIVAAGSDGTKIYF